MKSEPYSLPRLKKSAVVELAITFQNKDDFWKAIEGYRKVGMLDFSNDQIKYILDQYDGFIEWRKEEYNAYVKTLSPFSEASRDLDYGTPSKPRSTLIESTIDNSRISAVLKGAVLAENIVEKYHWRLERQPKLCWVHDGLVLRIYPNLNNEKKPRLEVGTKKTPCIFSVPGLSLKIRGDTLASFMLSCIFNEQFISHIAKWYPEYPEILEKWKEKENIV